MTIADVLAGNINKLENLKVPVKEEELCNAIREVAHDLRVCIQVMEEANRKAAEEQQQAEQAEQEDPQHEADPQ